MESKASNWRSYPFPRFMTKRTSQPETWSVPSETLEISVAVGARTFSTSVILLNVYNFVSKGPRLFEEKPSYHQTIPLSVTRRWISCPSEPGYLPHIHFQLLTHQQAVDHSAVLHFPSTSYRELNKERAKKVPVYIGQMSFLGLRSFKQEINMLTNLKIDLIWGSNNENSRDDERMAMQMMETRDDWCCLNALIVVDNELLNFKLDVYVAWDHGTEKCDIVTFLRGLIGFSASMIQ
ncbi:hypothetical protein BCR41DRAFT_388073 [Lobosporangium transversale]|uniref:Uncharacterized protein n=1 Tax=Lobosporangium transversale TaxID=64571 RepID=A0A1Y2GGP4_9FUNG|nr:hypothetical protein BCR41DRAFT_388073 [Lobosporangium transversale]ORZ10341.1 hypothetical protein BCR41DRAFT_388073 [Lobosporangium transversale]|eukprot:XP_021879248.1 hypothetical protein BCR41DRAFT_388073 [Lobosporangium transversale]